MADTNIHWVIGNLVDDAKVRAVGEGNHVANMRVATNYEFNGKKGADYHNIVAWGPLAEEAQRRATKGTRISVEGRSTTRSYDKDGEKRYITETVASSIKYLRDDEVGDIDF